MSSSITRNCVDSADCASGAACGDWPWAGWIDRASESTRRWPPLIFRRVQELKKRELNTKTVGIQSKPNNTGRFFENLLSMSISILPL